MGKQSRSRWPPRAGGSQPRRRWGSEGTLVSSSIDAGPAHDVSVGSKVRSLDAKLVVESEGQRPAATGLVGTCCEWTVGRARSEPLEPGGPSGSGPLESEHGLNCAVGGLAGSPADWSAIKRRSMLGTIGGRSSAEGRLGSGGNGGLTLGKAGGSRLGKREEEVESGSVSDASEVAGESRATCDRISAS